jgi:hypothetical protein
MAAEGLEALALFGFLAIGAVALFSFIAVASWSDARRKERESYYKNDMLKKLADSPAAGATAAIEFLREQDRLETLRRRQGMKIGGVVVFGTGIGVLFFLYKLLPHTPIYMVGVLMMLIGVALYGSSYILAAPSN